MTIVCGTDLSRAAAAAEAAAAALAVRRRASDLWLVHVFDPDSSSGQTGTIEELREQAGVSLERRAAALARATGAHILPLVIDSAGKPSPRAVAQALSRFAESKAAELLVVASQGYERLPLFRVGGTAERLAQLTPLPLLVVREADAFEAWANGKRPLRILLGVDRTESSEPAVEWVKRLRSFGPCDVTVGHVYRVAEAAHRYGFADLLSIVQVDPELEAFIARDVARLVGELPGEGQVRYRVKLGLGRTGDHLLDLAETERADLVCVGTHQKGGLSRMASVSGVALHFGHMSVACIPAGAMTASVAQRCPPLRRILIATDLSPFANRAIAYGYSMLSGGEVYLAHVVLPGEEPTTADETSQLVARLRALVPDFAAWRNTVTRTEIVHGSHVAEAICHAAERAGVDAICLASHGRSGAKRVLLGSVAEAVMRQTQKPVLIVRPPES
jgi:nucleotide-binding universal stress UspA family protein